jgi:general secretion pathway protein G
MPHNNHHAAICSLSVAAMLLASGVSVCGRNVEARMAVVRTQISNFGVSLDTFQVDVGRYPSTAEGLAALLARPENVPESAWRGPYMKRNGACDPWGTAYSYRCPGIHNTNADDIYSCGEDRITKSNGGDPDDINNWDPRSPRSIKYRLPHEIIALMIGAAIGLVASLLALIWRPPSSAGNGHGVFALLWMSVYLLTIWIIPHFLPQRLPNLFVMIMVLGGWIPGCIAAISGLRKGYFVSRVFAGISLLLLIKIVLEILMPHYNS